MSAPIECGVYRILHVATGKAYVGSTVSRTKRWSEHRKRLEAGTHHSRYLQYAWNKYGADAFMFEMLEPADPRRNELVACEQAWIERLSAYGDGYNMSPTAGSPLGFKHTAETRQKVSKAGQGRKLSPQHCALISARAKARGVARLHTPENRAKAGAKCRGRKRSAEAIAKMVETRRRNGKKWSAESLARLSRAKLGVKLPPRSAAYRAKQAARMTGCRPSLETRAKQSAAAIRRGPPRLTREQIERSATTRTGVKRTPEQKERMRLGREAARAARP